MLPILHSIVSVQATSEPGCYLCRVDATIEGVREKVIFGSRPNDPYGLGSEVRKALVQWIKEGKEVKDAE